MRLLLPLTLLVSPLFADHLTETARFQLASVPQGVAALQAGKVHLPAAVLSAGKNGSSLVVYRPDGSIVYRGALSAQPLGMSHSGASVFVGQRQGDTASLLQMRVVGARPAPSVYGTVGLDALNGPRLLRIGTRRGRPMMVIGHDGGVLLATPGRGREQSSRLLAIPGRRFRACTQLFDADGDKAMDLYLLTERKRLVRLEADRPGGKLRVTQDYAYRADRTIATAIAGAPGEIWLGGSRKGRAMLMLFDPAAEPSVRKFKDIFKDPGSGERDAVARLDLGEGVIEGVEILDQEHLLVTGSRNGKAWIGVLRRHGRRSIVHEATLSGAHVTAYCVNPSRYGWSIAAGTDARVLHLLLLPGDQAAPRGWDPLPGPDRGGGRRPGRGAEEEDDDIDIARRRVPIPSVAYFPRVEVDVRRGLDTTLYLLYLGVQPARITARFFDAQGQLVARTTILARRGTRTRLSLSDALKRQRAWNLDGYAVVTGATRRDLIAEAVVYRGAAAPESSRAFWR